MADLIQNEFHYAPYEHQLNNTRNHYALRSFDQRTVVKTDISLQGIEGRAIKGNLPQEFHGLACRIRIFWYKKRIYALEALGDVPNFSEADAERFFNSFRFLQ